MDASDAALVELGRELLRAGYAFVTPTPETHRRVNARPGAAAARNLRDVFGWSRPFSAATIPARLVALLDAAGELDRDGERLRSRVRFSTLAGLLFVHSAYPTTAADSVFFGPDTYRFASLIERRIASARRVVDVGCGSGAGGLSIGSRAAAVVLADVNVRALRFARVNAALQGATNVEIGESDVLGGVGGSFDLVIANPPYLADAQHRTYRDGGGALGIDLSLRITTEALARLPPGGRLLLYTATPVSDGTDPLLDALRPILDHARARFDYEELDPDVFGEELDTPHYATADRIAVVALDAVVS